MARFWEACFLLGGTAFAEMGMNDVVVVDDDVNGGNAAVLAGNCDDVIT